MGDRHGDELVGRLLHSQLTPEERGADSYDLLNELFRGYPMASLVPLLRSDDPGVVEAAAWLLSELGSRAAPLIGEVDALLESPSRKVRYWAIDVVNTSAGAADGRVISKALQLLGDDDVAVRRAALYFLSRASELQLTAAAEQPGHSEMSALVNWLRDIVTAEEAVPVLLERLATGDHLTRTFAVAAAYRTGQRGRSVLERAALLGEDDLSVFASRELAAGAD